MIVKRLGELKFSLGTGLCVVLALVTTASPAIAQQPAAQPKQPAMDPAMQMDPAMTMPSTVPKPRAATKAGQTSARPITEPTVPPADDGQEMPMHHHQPIAVVAAKLPQLGRSKHPEGVVVYQLEELERMAMTHNPALLQAQSRVRPMGPASHALSMVPSVIDALALYLTGNPIHFHDAPHRTP